MDRWQDIIDARQLELTRLFSMDDWSIEKVQRHLEETEAGVSLLRSGRLQKMLNERGIYQNLSEEEVFTIKADLGNSSTSPRVLIFANGVLLYSFEIERHYNRKQGRPTRWPIRSPQRRLVYVHLTFDFRPLQQPENFRKVQLLFFYATVHFEFSLDTRVWKPDSRGLYARTEALKEDHTNLSKMHNMIVEALDHYKSEKLELGDALMIKASKLQEPIVKARHHRQFSDMVAILLLVQRAGHIVKRNEIIANLTSLAQRNLKSNDPRRLWFECLDGLPLDNAGHLYLAFDALCRKLWDSKVGFKDAKACFSYNQASFPRADSGEFYRFFEKRPFDQLQRILAEVDADLDHRSHETFIIWHTVIRCLGREQRYKEMEEIARALCWRVNELGSDFDFRENSLLNYDCMLSFYLLGDALEAQGELWAAQSAFKCSVEIHARLFSTMWRGGMSASLRRLKALAAKLPNVVIDDHYNDYISMGRDMYSGVMSEC
ncbi:hypothetical protein BJY00DRAFT_199452 [Aspergillus carlsbadensis]|nr:hypothetical protein BJY00DRAFT_199452 [Aspergillus carlsbadensis]